MDKRSNCNQSNVDIEESQDETKMKDKVDDLEASLSEDKVDGYVRKLLKEKVALDSSQCPNAMRLIDKEVKSAQIKGAKVLKDVSRYVDIYREKPIKVTVKVLIPVKAHPNFNFVGKLLGPKGNSLKRLQEETMTRMLILGRGSMRDKAKEEELRQALDPKYSHLCDDLHVEISALAAPAEAHARIALALIEIRKYLVPDSYDEIRQEQMQQIQAENRIPGQSHGIVRGKLSPRGLLSQQSTIFQRLRSTEQVPPHMRRSQPGKSKLLLAQEMSSLEESYASHGLYDDSVDRFYDSPVGYARRPMYSKGYNLGAGSFKNVYNYPVNKAAGRIPRRMV